MYTVSWREAWFANCIREVKVEEKEREKQVQKRRGDERERNMRG